MLRGGEDIQAHVERKLGIRAGQSTADGRIFLKREEECLAACTGAPMMMVDHVYHEHLTPETVDQSWMRSSERATTGKRAWAPGTIN